MRMGGILVLVVAVLLGGGLLLRSLGREPRARAEAIGMPALGNEAPAVLRESRPESGVASLAPEEAPREELSPERAADDEDSQDGGTARLELRIVAKEDKHPLAEVHVGFVDPLDDLEYPRRYPVTFSGARSIGCTCPWTDADGHVALELRAGVEAELEVNLLRNVHARGVPLVIPPLGAGERYRLDVELLTRDDLSWFARVLDDASGAPLAGVRAGWIVAGQQRNAVSAADGVLVLDFASWEEIRVELGLAGYLDEQLVLERGHESLESALPVHLTRPAALEVRVRDGGGAPLASIPVEVTLVAPQVLGGGTIPRLSASDNRRRTDPEGTCTFETLPAREALAVVVRPGLGLTQREVVTLVPGETRALSFEVASGCSVQGLAVDDRGEPLAKLDLWRLAATQASPYLENQSESAVVAKARTDASGRFLFANVPAGEWWIGPAPYHRSLGITPLATRVRIAAGERVHPVTIVCASARFLRGRVLDPDGKPTSADVTAAREGASLGARSGGDGRFVVGPLSEGEWSLRARAIHDGNGAAAPSEVVRATSDSPEVVLRLRVGGGVSGTVRDARGNALPGAEVALAPAGTGYPETCVSGPDGSFSFSGAASGAYHLWAKSGASSAVLGPIELAPGQSRRRLELVLALGADLRVRLAAAAPTSLEVRVLSNGAALAGRRLVPGTEWRETLPAGAARVQLVRRTTADEPEVVEEQRIELRAGETTVVELAGGDSGPAGH